MRIKIVLFCRVSSREQEIEGYSLPAQEKLLKEYALRQGFNKREIKVFSISESASGKKQRILFMDMLTYVKEHNITVIICEKVDRITRNLKDSVDINDWLNEDPQRQVHSVKENVVLSRDSKSNEKFIWNIKVTVAQYYIDNLSEEVKKGQKEKLAQGWLPTSPPVGYKTIGDKGHKIHIVDEEKALLVKKMFEYYDSSNYSIRLLTEKMKAEGLRNKDGKVIVMSRIHQLLHNPFYIGKNRWNGIITQGEHEAIIDKDVFERVQRRLKGGGGPVFQKHFFLFNKLIKCDGCGGGITWEIHKGHIYGHCNHYKPCSQKIWVKEFNIDTEVAQIFEGLEIKNKRIQAWILKALKEGHEDETYYHNNVVNELRLICDRAKKRLDTLYDDKADGKITQEFYDTKYAKYTSERDNALDEIKKHTNADSIYLEKGINFYELAQNAKEKYLEAKHIEDKRKQMSDVFQYLKISDGKLYFEFSPQYSLLKRLADLTNKKGVVEKVEPLIASFEHHEKIDLTAQMRILQPVCPEMLRLIEEVRTYLM